MYHKHFSRKNTKQTEPIPGKAMVKMRSGGYGFKVGDWHQLRRFLILGTEGGTYYAEEKELTIENAETVLRCLEQDGKRVVDEIVLVSDCGLALKNDAALFALALAASDDDPSVRYAAMEALPKVARIGTHLFKFLNYAQAFRGWGRMFKRAIQNWFLNKSTDDLAYQFIKYRQREGWTFRDVLRKAHPKSLIKNDLFKWVVDGTVSENLPDRVQAFVRLNQADVTPEESWALIEAHNLPREAVPTAMLKEVETWAALLPHMPLTAMIRNLGTMSKVGVFDEPFNEYLDLVVMRLTSLTNIKSSRVHPITILYALKTYAQGQGFRSGNTWKVVPEIVDALNQAYYLAFDNIEPTNKRLLLGIDVSGSMSSFWGGNYVMQAIEFAAASAMVAIHTEPKVHTTGFDRELYHIPLSKQMRLDHVLHEIKKYQGGWTSAELPIEWALENNYEFDAIILYSDGESWAGKRHVSQAMNEYRNRVNPNAKLICVNFVATDYSVVDSSDELALNIVGNSPDVQSAITAFLTM